MREAQRRAEEERICELARRRHDAAPTYASQKASTSRLYDDAVAQRDALEREQRRARATLEALREGWGSEVTFRPRLSEASVGMATAQRTTGEAYWGDESRGATTLATKVEDRLFAHGEASLAMKKRTIKKEDLKARAAATPTITKRAATLERDRGGDVGARLHAAALRQQHNLKRTRSAERRADDLHASRSLSKSRDVAAARAATRAAGLYRDAVARQASALERAARAADDAKQNALASRHVNRRSREIAHATTSAERLAAPKKHGTRSKAPRTEAKKPATFGAKTRPSERSAAARRPKVSSTRKAERHEALYNDAKASLEKKRRENFQKEAAELDGCTGRRAGNSKRLILAAPDCRPRL